MELSHQAARIPLKFVFFEPSKINLVLAIYQWQRLGLRRDPFWVVRKNQTSKEFRRHDDSIPYLDNVKFILFWTTQNGSRLSVNLIYWYVTYHMSDQSRPEKAIQQKNFVSAIKLNTHVSPLSQLL